MDQEVAEQSLHFSRAALQEGDVFLQQIQLAQNHPASDPPLQHARLIVGKIHSSGIAQEKKNLAELVRSMGRESIWRVIPAMREIGMAPNP